MKIINENNCIIVIIDIQEKLVNIIKDSTIKENAVHIAKTANILNIPVLITEQYPKGLGSTIQDIKDSVCNAVYIEKTNFNAFSEQKFKEYISNTNKKQIIIFGIETHICVLQTIYDILNKGFDIFLVENASGSRNDKDKEIAIERLRKAGCEIVTTEMVIFELLKSSRHPKFKEIQALIK